MDLDVIGHIVFNEEKIFNIKIDLKNKLLYFIENDGNRNACFSLDKIFDEKIKSLDIINVPTKKG